MNIQSKLSLDTAWKDRLGIAHHRAPELFESTEDLSTAQHASAIRVALEDLGLSAVFCVQGVPTVGIVVALEFDRKAIMALHASLWNQGLMSLLLVIADDTMRAYSLMRTPRRDADDTFDADCQIGGILRATADALEFQNLMYGAESGRLWWDYQDQFRPKERVDQVLLDNLTESHRLLCDATHLEERALTSDAAQALLIQTMFIAYLEDRSILTERYFPAAPNDQANGFLGLLERRDVGQLQSLFVSLGKDFNGNIFVAPCSFDPEIQPESVHPEHLSVLADFRPGKIDMAGKQPRFWGYDFRYIPVELISAVYDRFLGEREAERRKKGAYYTPMFLADTVIAQVWDMLDEETKNSGEFLDPACGSAIFLVRMFQRLCEHARAKRTRNTIAWPDLLKILNRLHGWDINGGAVRVAVFSLYVALLEEVSPRDIEKLIRKGRLLPELWGKSLVVQDFFAAKADTRFAVIIGNPPWSSRKNAMPAANDWCKASGLPIPANEAAWAFSWKSLTHLAEGGIITFLLPAMGFLHNHAKVAVDARKRLITSTTIHKVIDFSDLRFQLFEKANRPACLLMYGMRSPGSPYPKIQYWTPKTDLNLRMKRILTLSTADRSSVGAETLIADPTVFKKRLWMREPDSRLFKYLSSFPQIGDFVQEFGATSRAKDLASSGWMIGQGYKTYSEPSEDSETEESSLTEVGVNPGKTEPPKQSQFVGVLPDIPIQQFQRLVQSTEHLAPASNDMVHRLGFEDGFIGNRILISRGIEANPFRLKAAYCEEDATFQSILQAITVPAGQERKGKLLAAFLNSNLAIWFAFHGTASFGSDRPELKQSGLRLLPFPEISELPDPEKSKRAADELIQIVDQALSQFNRGFQLTSDSVETSRRIDDLTCSYFGLSGDERVLIDDTMDYIVPSTQPHESNTPPLWRFPDGVVRGNYAQQLTSSLQPWIKTGEQINARLVAQAKDLSVLQLSFGQTSKPYEEVASGSVVEALGRLSKHMRVPLSGNFQLTPDLRIFADDCLYLVKPMQMRFWLRSAAMADADAIARDLQDAIELKSRAAS